MVAEKGCQMWRGHHQNIFPSQRLFAHQVVRMISSLWELLEF
jgi:hypothetical protein